MQSQYIEEGRRRTIANVRPGWPIESVYVLKQTNRKKNEGRGEGRKELLINIS